MRCGCPYCDAYMIQSETEGMACVCPSCGHRCNACLGAGAVIPRERLKQLTRPGRFSPNGPDKPAAGGGDAPAP